MSCIIIKSTEINKALEEETWGKRKQREAMRKKKTLAGDLSFLRLKNVSGDVTNFFPAVVKAQGLRSHPDSFLSSLPPSFRSPHFLPSPLLSIPLSAFQNFKSLLFTSHIVKSSAYEMNKSESYIDEGLAGYLEKRELQP